MLHRGAPEMLGRGVDDEYNFGHDGICGIGRTFTQTIQ